MPNDSETTLQAAESAADNAFNTAVAAAFAANPIDYPAIIAAGATRTLAQLNIYAAYIACLLRNAGAEADEEEIAAALAAAVCESQS